MEFINEQEILELLNNNSFNNVLLQEEIIEKSREGKGLSLEECAILLQVEDQELLELMFHTAKSIKEKIYGNRLVVFAPLYVSNLCVNNCLYCAFRRDNKTLQRKTLTLDEISNEADCLVKEGHKRVLLVTGEHPKKSKISFIGEAIERIYKINHSGNNIRRINVNTAPLNVDDFKLLKSFGIGTYQCFQETYDYKMYHAMHPDGPKRNYAWRLYAMDRALQAGIDDVGIGALFGLTNYKLETLALLSHAFNLDSRYGIGPHTISVPRLEPALNAPAAQKPPFAVDDNSFKKLVAIIRLAVPYTGIILSTRERPEIRRELFEVGISQISAGSRTSPGAYKESQKSMNEVQMEQFQLGDHRTLKEVAEDCCDLGYVPSFCTSCYRSERTGDRFMELAKSGTIGRICDPNALATFQEYAEDFLEDDSKNKIESFIQNELIKKEPKGKRRAETLVNKIKTGERDVYY